MSFRELGRDKRGPRDLLFEATFWRPIIKNPFVSSSTSSQNISQNIFLTISFVIFRIVTSILRQFLWSVCLFSSFSQMIRLSFEFYCKIVLRMSSHDSSGSFVYVARSIQLAYKSFLFNLNISLDTVRRNHSILWVSKSLLSSCILRQIKNEKQIPIYA